MLPLIAIGLLCIGIGAAHEIAEKRKTQKKEKVNGQNLPANIANPVPAGGDSTTPPNDAQSAPPPTT